MEKDKNKVKILVAIIIALTVLCILLATNVISFNSKQKTEIDNTIKETKAKTFKDVSGKYVKEYKPLRIIDGIERNGTITLNLYEDGIYTYGFSYSCPLVTIGNYTINGDKITLNALFNSPCNPELRPAKGKKVLTIANDGNTIIDNNIIGMANSTYNIKNAELSKQGNPDEFDLIDRLQAANSIDTLTSPEEPEV